MLFVTSLCFDLSVYDIFGAAAAGGTVRVAPRRSCATRGAWLRAAARASAITLWDSAPAALQQLAPLFPAAPDAAAPRCGWCCCRGDWIPVPLPDRVRAAFPGAAGRSASAAPPRRRCGPTGTRSARSTRAGRASPTAGRSPTRATTCWTRAAAVPVGVPGELYIGGDGLARGYARPAGADRRARSCPIPSPARRARGCTAPATWRAICADGNLEFLGRARPPGQDPRLPHRAGRDRGGARRATRRCARRWWLAARGPAGRQAPGGLRGAGGRSRPTPAELRALRCAARLPEYMVPAAFVLLAALPLTANGKLDRKALPAAGGRAPEPRATTAPRDAGRGDAGRDLGRAAGLERVGVDDNFFDLGGHSLLATQARLAGARAPSASSCRCATLFEAPTRGRAGAADRGGAAGAAGGRRRRRSCRCRGDGRAAALLRPAAALVPRPAGAGQPGYNIAGAAAARRARWTSRRCERASQESSAGTRRCAPTFARRRTAQPVQVIAAGRRRRAAGRRPARRCRREREREARAAGRGGGAAAVRPGARAAAARAAAAPGGRGARAAARPCTTSSRDGWSMGVLVRELAALYAAFAAGRPSPLPELPVQYADFAVWQREWLQGEVLERRARLLAAAARRRAARWSCRPTGRGRRCRRFRGAVRWRSRCRPRWSRRSRRSPGAQGATPVHDPARRLPGAAGRATRARRTSWSASPIANRTRREIEGLIGFFVNTLVLRTRPVAATRRFARAAGRVRETALGAYAHQDLPFERLVEELQPRARPGRTRCSR